MDRYNWKFTTVGGVTRVCIDSGEAIAHLDELDPKLWSVLSCPTHSIDLDAKTKSILDSNGDGVIDIDKVVRAAKWITRVINNPELLLKRESSLPLTAFNEDDAEGKQLKLSALQILRNLGLNKDSISIEETSDILSIFAKTKFNGDGVITVNSTDDANLQSTITDCISTVGGKMDRSGILGISAEEVERFYSALATYKLWADSKGNAESPYGEETSTALAIIDKLKDKVADYFMRCRLAEFNVDTLSKLDASLDHISTLADKDLSKCGEEIALSPLARVTDRGLLPLKSGINPAWRDTMNKMVVILGLEDKDYLSEEEWNAIIKQFDAYKSWMASKSGVEVEPLGYDRINAIIKENRREGLSELIAADKALESEANSIDSVDKLLHLYRDFYALLCNFVTLSDFYDRDKRALFMAGTLYIDQRCCELCIRVSDMAKSVATSGLSGMYILYLDCVAKHTASKMSIAAVVTDGDINDLRVGKNALFYDRDGKVWYATVVKIIDNPISIRQAFYAPYRKMSKLVEDTINKFAAEKDSKMMKEASAKITSAPASVTTASPEQKGGQPPFDIAKFAGIFAAIGLALGTIGTAVATLFAKFVTLSIWQLILVFVALLLIISGPSMLMAKMKLRKRDLSPILNANGWTMNSRIKVNETFGSTLTRMAKVPVLTGIKDPFADKRSHKSAKWIVMLIVLIVTSALYLYFTNRLPIGLGRDKSAVTTEIITDSISSEMGI